MASLRSEDSVDMEEGTQLAMPLSISADGGSLSSIEPSTSVSNTILDKLSLLVPYIIPYIWCAYKISVDPVFLYDIVIDDSGKCFKLDDWVFSPATQWFLYPLGTAINVVCICSLLIMDGLLVTKYEKIIWFLLLLFTLCTDVGPYIPSEQLSSLLTSLLWPDLRLMNFYSANIYLLQYFGTVILMFIASTRATRRSATLAKAIWVKAAFNLVLYIYGGHVFGGLWYAFAIAKKIDCWTKACKHNDSKYCSLDHFICGSGYNHNYTKLDEMCPTKTRNATFYDFGIYYDSLESGIVEVSCLPKKILYCLRWGLQNLSGFGQSLQVSKDAWENIFVISITIYGVILFVFFIGNVQRYLQSETLNSEKKRQRKLEIEQNIAKLSENLLKQIRRSQPDKWDETKGAEFENWFNNLPQDLKKDTRRELCLGILRTVTDFKPWSDESLGALCDCAKPVSYTEYAQIVQKGNSIDKMLLVVHGELQIYSFTSINTDSATSSSTSTDASASTGSASIARSDVKIDLLKAGELCGEELVGRFQNDPYSSTIPISTKTIEAVTKVYAFALTYYNLKKAFINHQTARRSNQEVQDQAPPVEPQP